MLVQEVDQLGEIEPLSADGAIDHNPVQQTRQLVICHRGPAFQGVEHSLAVQGLLNHLCLNHAPIGLYPDQNLMAGNGH